MNLLEETCKAIIDSNHATEDIEYIGSIHSFYCCTWEEFEELANIEYNNSSGSEIIAFDLVIIFKDKGILERYTYNKSECWNYIPPIENLSQVIKSRIKSLISTSPCGWSSLMEINEE